MIAQKRSRIVGRLLPVRGSLDGGAVRQRDDWRELVVRDVGQWQGAAGDANAEVEVVAALGGLGWLGRDVHRDLDGRVVLSDPVHGGLQVGIAGHNDNRVRVGRAWRRR